jgi:hypothetical protein
MDVSDNAFKVLFESFVPSWSFLTPPLSEALERAAQAIEAKHPLKPPTRATFCNSCHLPVSGLIYRCSVCEEFFLCADCLESGVHPLRHVFIAVHNPDNESCRIKYQPGKIFSACFFAAACPPSFLLRASTPGRICSCRAARFAAAGLGTLHPGTQCDRCHASPIAGPRYEKLDLGGFSFSFPSLSLSLLPGLTCSLADRLSISLHTHSLTHSLGL